MIVVVVMATTVVGFLRGLWPVGVQTFDELRRAGLVVSKEILRPFLEVGIKGETADDDVMGHD